MKHAPKYSPKQIEQFPYDPRTRRVPQTFHKLLLPNVFFTHFTMESLLSIATPLFSGFRALQRAYKKANKILIGSKKPPHKSCFCFKENSFLWRQPHFFLTWNSPTKVHAVSIDPRNQRFNGIIYKDYLLLMVSLFCHI